MLCCLKEICIGRGSVSSWPTPLFSWVGSSVSFVNLISSNISHPLKRTRSRRVKGTANIVMKRIAAAVGVVVMGAVSVPTLAFVHVGGAGIVTTHSRQVSITILSQGTTAQTLVVPTSKYTEILFCSGVWTTNMVSSLENR